MNELHSNPYMLPDTNSMMELISRVIFHDAASMPLLKKEGLDLLLNEAATLSFRRARTRILVNNTTFVQQDFELSTNIPLNGAYWNCAITLEHAINCALAQMTPRPFKSTFVLNDLIVQRYSPGSLGITPHRDHIRYKGLIAIIVLCGHGRYFICDDREGNNAWEIPSPAGHLILMRAPGLAGRKDRPFHYLKDITSERYTFGIRCDTTSEDQRYSPTTKAASC